MKLQGPRSELAFGVQGYPDAFCTLAQPPSCLYVVGEIDALREGLAVVGARNATPYGRFAAKLFSTAAARRGIPIISGGARGCDAAAHRAAIEAGGVTVAFLGGGCDELYPKENAGLFQDIVNAGGAVVSEQPWGMPPRPYMFRMRNRLIAGLARATLIVEAGLPSGTFSTADEALAANREGLVVPGSIMSETSRGSNRLLLEGAVPVVDEESFEGQLSALSPLSAAVGEQLELSACGYPAASCKACVGGIDARVAALDGDERELAEMVLANPMRLEQIAAEFAGRRQGDGASLGYVVGMVARLEGSGLITRYPDGRFGSAE